MEDLIKCTSFQKDFLEKFSNLFEANREIKISQRQFITKSFMKLQADIVEYIFRWNPSQNIDPQKPFVAIPIRNSSKLLRYTLENFSSNNFYEHVNVVIIDDRSEENLSTIINDYPVSYIRVTNSESMFNFSMLNNIAALIAYVLGGDTFIMWNSDLWLADIRHFNELLQRHKDQDSTISGSKLLYPLESLHDEEHSENMKHHFPDKLETEYKGSVQFGGSRWIPYILKTSKGRRDCFMPIHFRRFSNKDDHRVNTDYATDFVTGALQVIDLSWFIQNGGLNPSLPKNFQDTDLCLRAVESGKKVMYFGKDLHFYHDESYSFFSNKDVKKEDDQMKNDEAFFVKLWDEKLLKIIY